MKKILFLLFPLFFIACGGSNTNEESLTTDVNLTTIEDSNPNNKLEGLDANMSLVPPSF